MTMEQKHLIHQEKENITMPSYPQPKIAIRYGKINEDVTTSQTDGHACKETLQHSPGRVDLRESDNVRSGPKLLFLGSGQESQPMYIPLASRTIHSHSHHKIYNSSPSESQQTCPQDSANEIVTAFLPVHNHMCLCGLRNGGIGDPNRKSRGASYQARSLQSSTASMYNEAGCHTPSYQSAGLWEPNDIFQGGSMDSSVSDLCGVDVLSWDTVSVQAGPLTAWGNALAGIGDHFAENPYQDRAGPDELVLE